MKTQILVIGGGASGMMAAAAAASSGARVMLCESGSILGKKILATGNGRCNFSNRKIRPADYRSAQNGAAAQVLKNFDGKETEEWFRSIGIPAAERSGCLYPRSMQASSVRDALEAECIRSGVDIQTGIRAEEMVALSRGFRVIVREYVPNRLFDRDFTPNSERITANAVILACGGKASPKTGSDGNGYALAASLGHRIVTPVPALVPLISGDPICRVWQGVRTAGRVSIYTGRTPERRKKAAEDTGELQLTKNGISGIPVFQVSRYASGALAGKQRVQAELNFLPDSSRDRFQEELLLAAHHKKWQIFSWLHGYFPDRLCRAMIRRADLSEEMPMDRMNEAQIQRLMDAIFSFWLDISGSAGFDAAQVTAGGVSTREIQMETMESRICPGLFFAGEIVDVDGICGGYNLQFAWSSGYTAGHAAGEYVRSRLNNKQRNTS